MDLSACAKGAVIWIINPKVQLHSETDIGFDLSYFRYFIVNFVHLEYYSSWTPGDSWKGPME